MIYTLADPMGRWKSQVTIRLRPLGAGCGSSSSSTAATSNAPIKVGVIVPENTQIYNAPDIVAAMRAAAYAETRSAAWTGAR